MSRYPLSLAGTLLVVLSGCAWWIGRAQMDLVLTLVGLWGWVLAGCLGIAAGIGAWRLRRGWRRAIAGAGGGVLAGVEGRPMDGLTDLPRPRLPLLARPTVRWSEPPARAELIDAPGAWRERVTPGERIRTHGVERRLEVADVLGLWRLTCRLRDEAPLRVLPDPGRLEASELESCLASGDLLPYPFGPASGDRVDARPYTRSDPARMILWKVYARSRELMVRTPEPARAPERAPLLYLVAGPDDAAAAATAHVLSEGRLLSDGAWLAADGTPEPVATLEAARDAIADSAGYRDQGGVHLASALDAAAGHGLDGVVLICPARLGPWCSRVEAAVARAPERFLILAAGDAGLAPPRRPLWHRALVRDAPAGGPTFDQMIHWTNRWSRWGSRVVLVDRRSGRLQPLAGALGPHAHRLEEAG